MFEKRARAEATLESEKMNVDEIVSALRENAEWCDANEYEVPLCMGDNQRAAIDLIESLQAQLVESQRRERTAVEDLKKHRKCKCDCCYYADKQGRYIPCRDCQSPISNYGDGWQWRGRRRADNGTN